MSSCGSNYVKTGDWTNLLTPFESVYTVDNYGLAKKLGLSLI